MSLSLQSLKTQVDSNAERMRAICLGSSNAVCFPNLDWGMRRGDSH
jgi:hypothetical protein